MSEVSFDELFILGKHHVGYQPAADVFPDGMHSFELFGSLENGMAAYPDIPKRNGMSTTFLTEKTLSKIQGSWINTLSISLLKQPGECRAVCFYSFVDTHYKQCKIVRTNKE